MSFLPDFEAIVSERRRETKMRKEKDTMEEEGEEEMRPLFSSRLHACQRRKDALFPSSFLSSLGLSQFGKASEKEERRKEKEERRKTKIVLRMKWKPHVCLICYHHLTVMCIVRQTHLIFSPPLSPLFLSRLSLSLSSVPVCQSSDFSLLQSANKMINRFI